MNQWLQFLRAMKRGHGGGGTPPPPPPPPPVANFTGTPLSGTAPVTVAFTDTSTNSPNAWNWDFGDGGTSNIQNPSHEFINPGDYTVSLEVFNAGGSDSEVKAAYVSVTGAVSHLTISGPNFIDVDGTTVWVPYGLTDGHFELTHAGDEAADAAKGANCLRTVVREYGTYGTGYQQDMQQEGQPGNLKPAYLADIVTRLTASRAAGMKNFVAMDSDKGQGAEASGGNDFFSGSTEGLRQRGLFIDSAVYLADNYGDLIDAMEPLVEPNSGVVASKEILWAYQEEFMTAVLAVAPHMLFAIGPRDYAAGNIANAINPAWLLPTSPFYQKVFMTCNFLSNLSMNVTQRAARAALVASTRNSQGVPAWINQIATHNSDDPDNTNLDATMTLLDESTGGYIGYNYWERVSMAGTADGLYYLSNTGDPNSSRLEHTARIAVVSRHFTHTPVSGDTWENLNLLAANMGPNYDYYTRVWVNLNNSGRAWCPSTNAGGYGYENVTLKSNGYPATGTTSTRVFMGDVLDADADVYSFECTGNLATGAASITNAGGGTLSARNYNLSTNKTTCTITITGSADNIIALKFNNVPADFGDVKLHPSAYPLTTTQKFRTEALDHFAMFKTLRFMDWMETNGSEGGWAETGNPDTDWATSRAAAYGSGWRHQHSLGACFDFFIEHGGLNIWTNIPARATDAYIASYIADGLARLPAGKKWFIEFGNELWNNALGESTAYQDIRTAAFTAANVKAGTNITSLSRTGSTVTAGCPAHGLITGATVYVRHKTNAFASGNKTITVVNSDTISWTDAGTAGSITHNDDDTFIFLNPTHTLCRPLNSHYQPESPTANYVRIRYMLQRARTIWTTLNNNIATSDVKVVLGTWMASTFNYVPCLTWAVEEYGDLSWLYSMTPALYMEPANMNSGAGGINSVDDVFTQLDANAVITLGRAARWNNLMLTWGMQPTGYEAGPHTHGGDGVSTPYIVAAHSDDRMRTRLKDWWQSWRNRGGAELCFFHAGVTKQPTTGNATWPITYGAIADDATSKKYTAFTELSTTSALAVQESGVNYGTIRYIDILPDSGAFLQQTSTWLLIDPTKVVPDIKTTIAVDAAGDYTLALDACTNGGVVPAEVRIDGVLVWTGNLPTGSVFSVAPGQAFSNVVHIASAGAHVLTFHVANASRADWVGLYRIRLT